MKPNVNLGLRIASPVRTAKNSCSFRDYVTIDVLLCGELNLIKIYEAG